MRPNKRPYYYSCSRLTKKCFLSCSLRSACLISMDLLVCFNSLLWVRSGTCPGCDPRFLRKAGPQLGRSSTIACGVVVALQQCRSKRRPLETVADMGVSPRTHDVGSCQVTSTAANLRKDSARTPPSYPSDIHSFDIAQGAPSSLITTPFLSLVSVSTSYYVLFTFRRYI